MRFGSDSLKWVFIFSSILHGILFLRTASSTCELNFTNNDKLYNFNLAFPIPQFPHGILSEDGFYRVAVNKTVIWFQLCDGMIFNHEPPMCVDCSDCGGPSHCGMDCSALVANNIEGYDVCTTIGRSSSIYLDVIEKENPEIGVTVKMSSTGIKVNCSLSVSVLCDMNGLKVLHVVEKVGSCDYSTVIRHPSGCAKSVHSNPNPWGLFGTFFTVVFCLLGVYLFSGIVYRHFVLKIHGIDAIPNLEFWTSLPQRTHSLSTSLMQKFKEPSDSRVNF